MLFCANALPFESARAMMTAHAPKTRSPRMMPLRRRCNIPDVASLTRATTSLLRRRPLPRTRGAIPLLDIIDHHLLEVRRHRRAAQGDGLLAVDEHRRGRRLAGAGERD